MIPGVQGNKQCFDRKEWRTLASLINHYHWTYQIAGIYLRKNHKQEDQILNLQRHKTELLLEQNNALITGDKLRLELDSERRKKRLLAWLAGTGAVVSAVLGVVVYGVARK